MVNEVHQQQQPYRQTRTHTHTLTHNANTDLAARVQHVP